MKELIWLLVCLFWIKFIKLRDFTGWMVWQVKKYVTSKDDSVQSLDMNTESEMKQLILQPLGTEETHQLSAVQVIGGVAEIIQN